MLQPASDQDKIFAVAQTPTARRLKLLGNGYAPLPIEGKRPPLKDWQKKTVTNAAEIELWEKVYPYASNTGILTQLTPALDIDIMNLEAAEAIETLARERFEERGIVLVRTGQAPKRAILFRTDTPFKKITGTVVTPKGDTDQKIELLADGQQVVVFGTHPKTGKPYSWFGGEPSSIKHEELPYMSENEAKQIVADAVALLVKEFGYRLPPVHPTERGKANGHDPANWCGLVDNIVQGRALHDSLRDLAGKLIASGMGDGAAVNFLRAQMNSSSAPRDDRWQARYDDIPRAVSTASEKIGEHARQPSLPNRLLQSSAQFTGSFVPPDPLISGILQRRFIYALTGHTGRGKTAIALLFAAHVALGRRLGDLDVEKGRVLILAGENPTDAKMRWIALSQQMQFDRNEIDVHWIEGVFKLSEAFEQIRREVEELGGVDFIIIDSSAAFFEGDDENNNAQQAIHAKRLRDLTHLPGGPCVLVLCHPPKNAGDDNLQPRGGGSYVAEMDGNLTVTKDDMAVELHWQTKLRGPDFAPVNFSLRSVTHEELKDTKGRLIPTVIAEHLSDTGQEEMTKASRGDEDLALHALSNTPRASFAELADTLGWYAKSGKPNRTKAQRTLGRLQRDKLIKKDRGRYEITEKGQKALKQKGTD
jgi:AAA domain/Bifunctional DNA primase/polymerase, N-terminal